MRKTIAITAILFLLASAFAFAAPQAKTAKAATHQATGTIKSVTADSLVVTHKVGAKEQDTTFVLNADTKKEGDVKAGAKVTVHYKVEGGKDIATIVAVAPAKK
jgi:hypothetical protein